MSDVTIIDLDGRPRIDRGSLIDFGDRSLQIYNLAGDRYNEILSDFFDFDYSAIGGNPIDHYYTRPSGIIISEAGGLLATANNGFNIAAIGPSANASVFADYQRVSKHTLVANAVKFESVYINTRFKTVDPRSFFGTFIHELLHESKFIDSRAKSIYNELLKSDPSISGFSIESKLDLFDAIEHYVLATKSDAFYAANDLPSSKARSSWGPQEWLAKIDSLVAGLDMPKVQVAVGKIALEVRAYELADALSHYKAMKEGVSLRTDGSVDYWRGLDGITRQTRADSYYTERMLDAYGREIGNGAAGMSFGGHLRAIADALGFDGELGIQGTYAREGEGDENGSTTSPTSSPRPRGNPFVDHEAPEASPRPRDNPFYPILLDLNGNGIEITALDKSTRFVVDEDGLKHRTAWAGVGDGVLFVDVDGNGEISNAHEYVFTEWDAGSDDDMEALRAAFDTNGDGKLTSADARFGLFRVLVTNADGSTTAQTLAALGITEIDLRPDTTFIELPDGSVITGQTTFVMGGTTRTSANGALMAEGLGATVADVVSRSTTVTVVSTGRGETGGGLNIVTQETTESQGLVANSGDRGGGGGYAGGVPSRDGGMSAMIPAGYGRALTLGGFKVELQRLR